MSPFQGISVSPQLRLEFAVQLLINFPDGREILSLGVVDMAVDLALRLGAEIDLRSANGTSNVAVNVNLVVFEALLSLKYFLAAIALP